jgi:ribulose-phosphate 3-epimerase
MDGVFVPNISFGMPIIKNIKSYAKKDLDVHLMIVNPDKYITTFKNIGANILTVHYEACNHLNRTLTNIREEGMKSGVALNPHTSVDLISDILNDVDVVCIMSVNPGFGGQSFIQNTYEKVKNLDAIRKKNNSKFLIEIDGGVSTENARELIDLGADILVAGSFVFNSNNPIQTIKNLKTI